MKRSTRFFALVLSVFFVASSKPALASETDALLNKLVEKKILTAEEAQEVRNEMAKESGPQAKMQEADTKDVVKKMAGGAWLDQVKWSGDLRLRHETQFRDPSVVRNRERFRLRFGFTAKPWDPLAIGVRLATGASGDPVSANQSFTSTFDKKAIFVDRAYGRYTPWPWVNLVGGKMDIPFETSSSEGTVWDYDVTPEGVAIQLKSPESVPGLKSVVPVQPFVNLAAFQISELNADSGDPGLLGAQVGANVDLPWGMTFHPSAAYYDFTAIKNRKTSNVTNAPAGNSTVTEGSATKFLNDYDVVNIVGKLSIPEIFSQPVLLVGDWAHNTHAKDNINGWMAGLEVGQVTERIGSWKGFYYFKRLEPDAVFGAIADSDFGAGGTNHFGHIFGVEMGLNKWASAKVKYFRTDEINGTQNRNDTLQADLQMKF